MASAPTTRRPLRKAVLPVAGFGTRVLPATKSIPKELLPVFDRPAIQYVVDEALDAGIEHIVFVTGRNKGAIEDYFDRAYELEVTLREKGKTTQLKEIETPVRQPGAMSFTRQQAALGLGHAVWCARDIIGDEPFAVMLPDMLMMAKPSCLAQMVETYNQVGGNVIAVEPCDDPSMYGVIDPESRAGRVIKMRGMVEKPPRDTAPSNLFISGRYILQPEIFDLLADQGPGAGNEIQLTDSMVRLMQTQPFHALEYDGRTYDCGDKLGYLRATAAFALAHEEFGAKAAATLKQALADKGQ
ncbi:UTP--glucose-1-phosphate uridylyltransferase GalU [Terricaulis silvestris]|uniref:UTP--glucose-1-phosphate uridylyltransferase n=1 Tax=Terricaulis silvestris TaxID=2686094 RepID=A0A6I6MVZ8_9CAUL|nr:UTP--glucose-1-phosphate uridylyltransferase GalU [Terricaulis silvestris]QGZ96574.1 UTP--glucose-1-phosphate uridylyltransferase [Terricaulis silvestris]